MPPPVDVSEDESTGESIPFKKPDETVKNGDVEERSEVEEEGEDIYVVEKIIGHEWGRNGKLHFVVKWKGYDDPEDQTLEPEENLDGAKEAIEEYFDAIGGRPEKPNKKRKSMGSAAAAPDRTAAKKTKRSSSSFEEARGRFQETPSDSGNDAWMPKSKNWEKEVQSVDTLIKDDKSDSLQAMVTWINGRKSKIPVHMAYQRMPQKMLQFYESHLTFKTD
ncbi:hypothetical protein VTO42DRAFT_8267 [Malbranchea cinnamomea]